jgi:RHS repeat-associated protein
MYGISVHAEGQNPYLYNGKELNQDLGLNWYAYGARYYDPSIGRFTGVDPIADQFPHVTTYNYAENEPIANIDLWGLQKYNITSGELSGPKVTNDITQVTHRPKLKSIEGVVLHRTVSSNAQSAVRTTKNNKGKTGFHVVVDTDGSSIQVNNFENRANHVGKPKGTSGIDNFNSIGVEVVGLHLGKDKAGNEQWEGLTEEQVEATAQILATILTEYDLEIGDVYHHEDVSYKTDGEGQTVFDDIFNRLYQYSVEQNAEKYQGN